MLHYLKTLHTMAIQKSVTLAEFGGVSGMGEHKLKLYGEMFVKLIREHQSLAG